MTAPLRPENQRPPTTPTEKPAENQVWKWIGRAVMLAGGTFAAFLALDPEFRTATAETLSNTWDSASAGVGEAYGNVSAYAQETWDSIRARWFPEASADGGVVTPNEEALPQNVRGHEGLPASEAKPAGEGPPQSGVRLNGPNPRDYYIRQPIVRPRPEDRPAPL